MFVVLLLVNASILLVLSMLFPFRQSYPKISSVRALYQTSEDETSTVSFLNGNDNSLLPLPINDNSIKRNSLPALPREITDFKTANPETLIPTLSAKGKDNLMAAQNDEPNSTKSALSRAMAEGMVILRPALMGRLGNQIFSWSSTWGLSKQLAKAIGNKLSIRPVIWRESELYRIFGDQLEGIVANAEELEHFEWEKIRESNALFDGTIFEKIVNHLRNGTRGGFILGDYMQSWRYFHSESFPNSIDIFELYNQFAFPKYSFQKAMNFIDSLKRDAEFRNSNTFQSTGQRNTNNISMINKLYLNKTPILTNNKTIGSTSFVAIHIRLGDHHKSQKSRLPNREFFLHAATQFFAISQKVP